VKFTARGQVVVRVQEQVVAAPGAPLLLFEVEDTGIGIRQENLRAIFEAFSQEDGTTTRHYGGTGLGLAICKQLIELMGGQIGVRSTPGAGSTFWFTVSLLREPDLGAEDRPEALTGTRILVVDDNATNRDILREQLQSWHAEVTEASSAAVGLAELKQAAAARQDFDLAVLDYQMPEMSGMDLVRAMRADPALRDVPVVMLSSMTRTGEDTDWGSQRLAAVLTKPARRTQLYTALSRVLAGAQREAVAASAPKVATPGPPTALGMKLLLVEDNPVNQAVACGMLERLGCHVTVAGNGREGVAAFATGTFDVVLMDCHMPELDGYAASALIRDYERDHGSRRTPIVALTANAMEGDREKCQAAGMDEYLTKPYTLAQMQSVLEGLQQPGHAAAATTPSTPADETLALDPRALEQIRALQRPGGPALVDKVIGLYLDSSRGLTDKLGAALAAGDSSGVREAAHALKSSSANLGATVLAGLAAELEALGRENRLDAAPLVAEQLFAEYRRVVLALGAERAAA